MEGFQQYRYFSRNAYSFFDIAKWVPAVFSAYYCATWLSNIHLDGMNVTSVSSEFLISSGLIILSGYIGLRLGLGRSVKDTTVTQISANSTELNALLAIIIFGMTLIFWGYAYRIELGIFYNHTRHVANVTGNLQLLAISVQLPTVALLGVYKMAAPERNRKWARYVFYSGTLPVILLMLMSSQIRLTIAATFVAYLFTNASDRKHIAKSRPNLILLLLIFVLIVLTSFSFRIVNESDVKTAKNQFTHALFETTGNLALVMEKDNAAKVFEKASERTAGQIRFLQELIRRESYYPRLGGELIVKVLNDNIPKLLWPDKPPVVPIDIYIQQKHNMIKYDASGGPVIFLYVGFGTAGVFLGFLAMGYALKIYSRQPRTLFICLIPSFVFPAFLNLESELLTSVIAGVRSCIVFMAAYIVIYLILQLSAGNSSQRLRQRTSSVL